jgi:hypothetical protein
MTSCPLVVVNEQSSPKGGNSELVLFDITVTGGQILMK